MAGESVIMEFLRSQEDKQNQNGQQEKQIVYIDIQDLKASEENFYGIRDLEALKASISLHGLLQPILVIPAEIEGKYTVLGGGRRRQAIEELVDEGMEELRKVPCIISDGRIQGEDAEEQEPDEVKELIGKLNIISANSFREKTDWEKMEETLQIGSIIKELKSLGKLKGNVREMQVELSGIKGTQIARYNAITNHLSVELMQAFKNNDFGISVAYELSRLSEDYQQQAWELLLENKVLTLSDTERLHNLKKADESLEGQINMQGFLEQQEIHANNNQEDIQGILTEEKENAAKRTPDPEESAENLPSQMNIEDDLEVLPEKVPYFTKGGEPYGYTWHGVVREYLQTAYTKDSAKIGFMGKEYLVLRRPERTFFYDDKGNTLFEVENARLEEEYNWMNQKETSIAPPQQNEETEVQQEVKEELQTEPVKVEKQTEKNERTTEKTDIELLKEELEKAQRNLTMSRKEYTEKDIRVRKQKLIVGALAGMIADVDNELPEPVQPPLPKLKNNDQRKEWLGNYRDWGIWYKDEHIGTTYYRYQFENSAVLIVEEYENESGYTGTYISSYFHLVGGPEPDRKSGIPKWNRNKKYNRYQNSETELIEFLKEIQKG